MFAHLEAYLYCFNLLTCHRSHHSPDYHHQNQQQQKQQQQQTKCFRKIFVGFDTLLSSLLFWSLLFYGQFSLMSHWRSSSILVCVPSCILNTETNFVFIAYLTDHASSQASTFANDVSQEAAPSLEQLPSSIMTDQKAAKENPYKDYLKFTPESLDFGYQ